MQLEEMLDKLLDTEGLSTGHCLSNDSQGYGKGTVFPYISCTPFNWDLSSISFAPSII